MQITKLGHCCLILKVDGVTIVTDPGSFTTEQNTLTGVDCILITHEHGDHFHIESVAELLKNNPQAVVVTNSAVQALIQQAGITATVNVVEDGMSATINNVLIEGFGSEHAAIYGEMGKCVNTGYLVESKFYFPGDNFHVPNRAVEILALPTAGPWMKMSEAIDFAKVIKARVAFGVHDAIMVPNFRGFIGNALKMFVPETEYVTLADGESKEF